jgi:hypothetical protein
MEIKLGFGAVPKPQYVFVSRESDHCWYMLSEDKKTIPVYERALTGVITGIEVNKKVETSFGESEKTDLYILADKPYIIRSGSESYFSKGLLLSLNALTDDQLCHPLTITASPGDRTIVFCSIYDPVTYRSVGVSWDGHKEIDWQALGKKVSQKLHQKVSYHNLTSNDKIKIPTSVTTTELHETLIAQTDVYLAQLNWTQDQGRQYLLQNYDKRSRHQLTDAELLDFIDFLKLQLKQLGVKS